MAIYTGTKIDQTEVIILISHLA